MKEGLTEMRKISFGMWTLGIFFLVVSIMAAAGLASVSSSRNGEAAPKGGQAINWLDSADISWYENNKTAANFTLSTPEELAGLALLVCSGDENGRHDFAGCVVCLSGDIDLSGKEWTPIGINTSTYFNGTFDGRGHVVSGLGVVTRYKFDTQSWGTGYYGLFGYADSKASVKNLVVRGNVVASGDRFAATGGIIGAVNGSNQTASVVANCSFSGSVKGRAGSHTGGIAGRSSCAELTNCAVRADITADNTGASNGDQTYFGGIVGTLYGSNSVIAGCYYDGSINYADNTSPVRAGGLAGDLQDSGTLQNCAASVDINVRGGKPAYQYSIWQNCAGGAAGYSSGVVNNVSVTGSIALYASDDKYNVSVGGLVGLNDYNGSMSYAENSCSSCKVSARSQSSGNIYAGSLVGYNEYNSYNPKGGSAMILNNRWVKGAGVPVILAGNWNAISNDYLGNSIASNDAVSSSAELPSVAVIVPSVLRLVENKSFKLHAAVYPVTACNKDTVTYKWLASNGSVISVAADKFEAVVKGLKSGAAQAVFNCGNLLGGESSYNPSTYVAVYRRNIEGLRLDKHAFSVGASENEVTLAADLLPDVDTPSYSEVKWTYEVVSGDNASVDDITLYCAGDSRTAKILFNKHTAGASYRVTVAAVDDSALSDSCTISVVSSDDAVQPSAGSGSSGGCNAGAAQLLILAALPLIIVKFKR